MKRILIITLVPLFFSCSKDDTDSPPDNEEYCPVAIESLDDAYLKIINDLSVNIYIEYENSSKAVHMWATSCELLGVSAGLESAIIITQCESGFSDIDGNPVDCGNTGISTRYDYNLNPSDTVEIVVDEDFMN